MLEYGAAYSANQYDRGKRAAPSSRTSSKLSAEPESNEKLEDCGNLGSNVDRGIWESKGKRKFEASASCRLLPSPFRLLGLRC